MLTTSRFHLRFWPVWVSVGAVLGLWIACKWFHQDWFDDGFKYVAKASSLSATTLMCWCLVLSARFRALEDLFGGLDKVYQVHKRLGKLLCLVLAPHPLFLAAHRLPDVSAYLGYFAPAATLQDRYALGKDLGLAALIALCALVALSLRLIMRYEAWKRLHGWLGPVFLLVMVHVHLVDADVARYAPLRVAFWGMLLAGAASWVYIRLLYERFGPRHAYAVESIETVGGAREITLRPLGRPLDFKASQFVYLVIRTPPIPPEPHPYSIASGYSPDGRFKLGIKEVGDHTRSLAHLAPGDRTDVYGPYGRFSEPFFNRGRDCVFIGGGIGITPFIGMWHVALHSEERLRPDGMDSQLKARHPELSSDWTAPRIALFYVCRTREEASFDDDIRAQAEQSPLGGLEQARQAGFDYVLHESQTHGRFGIPHMRDVLGDRFPGRLFFLCGPTPMMEALAARLLDEGVSPLDILIEDFNLV
ncbi:Dihydroorotate dehydrogenase B (NAD(+)), electron transfer subunit [Fundidesulfovibrio magnetotacticus]|uniref:Dihydroorotate dehydrogenase B (NAD(+)), electron transfer subunit n=1 Tax=Fundidesulfovibrio magnetotacticus TaxID=2730080 RepID=A0A6V8LWW2_9BACT|nr:ferric reductase-like transmembrane domain-containing protein [Fundidesulfovibrio magnetotacticus]GFK95380.1 Dihydroorotate dehydrogenase B (NAD(+)), electron transfer subunit [Fundidesulfovibrio magnetotacticus]